MQRRNAPLDRRKDVNIKKKILIHINRKEGNSTNARTTDVT
jgi:hypothetical protein